MPDDIPHCVTLRPAGAWTADDAAGFAQALGAFGETIASVSGAGADPEPQAELAFATTESAEAFFQESGATKTAVRDQLLVRAGPLRLLTIRYPDQLADFSVEYSARYATAEDLDFVFQLLLGADDLVRGARRSKQFPLDPQGPVRVRARLEPSPAGPIWALEASRDVPGRNRLAGKRSFRASAPAVPLPAWPAIVWVADD